MKICSYCGRENSDELTHCRECGTELQTLLPPEPPEISPGENLQPKYVNFTKLGEIISVTEGFPYPDWKKVWDYINQNIARNIWNDAWREAALQWLEKFRAVLGSEYFLNESDNFFLLFCREQEERKDILAFVENVRQQIQNELRGIKFKEVYGKQVILIFDETDDYYRYISYYYPADYNNLSWGIFLNRGYAHVALPFYDIRNVRTILTHELAHNALFTLPIPRWLNEGVAKIFESQISRSRGTGFDADMDIAERHHAYWTPENIQTFWAGRAFLSPDSSELSYSLANILMNLIADEKGDFKNFLQNANYSDSGEAAFNKVYGKSLGQIAGIFLGDGDWKPKPEIINSQFEQRKQKQESS
jgi:hypothetical protein